MVVIEGLVGKGLLLLAPAKKQTNKTVLIGGKRCEIHDGIVRVLVLHDEVTDSPPDPESTLQEIRQKKLPVDIFTFLQKPSEPLPKFPYHLEKDNLAVLEISTWTNWFRRQVHPNTRTNIRKAAKKGLVVRIEPFGDHITAGLVEVFNEAPIRRGRRYPYYGWDAEMVNRTWAIQLDQSSWVVAYYRESFVGFIKLIVGEGTARTSGTVAKEAHRDKCPMNALLSECVRLCASMGIRLLVYGKFTYGRKGETSLTEFKKHNGFKKLEVPRYYIPLTMRGRIGLRLGLHHSLIDVIPGPVQRTLLKLRSRWYEAQKPVLATLDKQAGQEKVASPLPGEGVTLWNAPPK